MKFEKFDSTMDPEKKGFFPVWKLSDLGPLDSRLNRWKMTETFPSRKKSIPKQIFEKLEYSTKNPDR